MPCFQAGALLASDAAGDKYELVPVPSTSKFQDLAR